MHRMLGGLHVHVDCSIDRYIAYNLPFMQLMVCACTTIFCQIDMMYCRGRHTVSRQYSFVDTRLVPLMYCRLKIAPSEEDLMLYNELLVPGITQCLGKDLVN